ncbi:hypothetical protein CAPTEDRAFT_222821 [Capitella teleta]|uniref:Grh/CP2 DB domain-containing protein n=1 Tax=Capitella teleta TaxID=283909 RepID=R7TJY1_CAPTE|nr:hypothetical protein CAPTEDRAFT_222821 [Capitella teleta]|eukprot:ELT94029.1 hypothetical protein CAPTEDRAFT_222821 [Capitella teleta]
MYSLICDIFALILGLFEHQKVAERCGNVRQSDMTAPDFSHGLSQWLANIKTDDIDGGLAADFDGSLSGLGVELGSSTYNMSEALLALPVFKQEAAGEQSFQYVLAAATSPATKMYEETLTYLNQGQSYEIKLKKLGEMSIVRVVFHERRLQYMESEQITTWKHNRPGDRILDIDIPLSYGLLDVNVDPNSLNSIDFSWDPSKSAGIYIRVNCISTEFTAKKHGGEKGVPFRIQVETYIGDIHPARIVHCSSCQVKVFKPKGADRKHKTDRERIEKRSETEKLFFRPSCCLTLLHEEKYQPSYECTVLTEIPLEQVRTYLDHIRKQLSSQDGESPPLAGQSPPSFSSPKHLEGQRSPPGGEAGSMTFQGSEEDEDQGINIIVPPSNVSEISLSALTLDKDSGGEESEGLLSGDTAQQVTQWLHANRFANFVRTFQNFSGADLLRLSRDDLIQICGVADGIRLNNALQSRYSWKSMLKIKQSFIYSSDRTVRPRLTVYVYQNPFTGPPIKTEQPPESPSTSLVKAMSCSSISEDSSPTPPITSRPQVTPRNRPPPTPPPLPGNRARTNKEPVTTTTSDRKAKRTYADHDSGEDLKAYSKKQRTRTLELYPKSVFHAVYLESLSLAHLKGKLALLFSIQPSQISQVYVLSDATKAMHILVTDSVVENFKDQCRYSIEGMQEDDRPGYFYIVLKSDS